MFINCSYYINACPILTVMNHFSDVIVNMFLWNVVDRGFDKIKSNPLVLAAYPLFIKDYGIRLID